MASDIWDLKHYTLKRKGCQGDCPGHDWGCWSLPSMFQMTAKAFILTLPFQCKSQGPDFNIKTSSYQYRKSHCGDKMVVRSSYLHNGIFYTGKMSSLHWIRAQISTEIWTKYWQNFMSEWMPNSIYYKWEMSNNFMIQNTAMNIFLLLLRHIFFSGFDIL